MPGHPSEPDKYSIDDMMERLTAPLSDSSLPDGELVTREDGTQAIRIKKRKRRSHQPHKAQEARSKKLKIGLIVAGVVGAVGVFITFGGLIVYSNSSPYRNRLIGAIEKQTGAELKVLQFRVNPTGINAGEASLQWPAGHLISRVVLRSLRGQTFLSNFLSNKPSGPEMGISEGDFEFQIPGQGISQFPHFTPDGFPLNFERLGIGSANIKFGESTFLSKTEVSIYPNSINGNSEIRLTHGAFASTHWPSLKLDRALLELRGQDVEVVSLTLQHAKDDRGTISLNGTLHPLTVDRNSTLSVKAESFLLPSLVGEDLERFISGRVDTRSSAKSNYLSFEPKAKSPIKLVLDWTNSINSQIDISNFPFLYSLVQATQDSWFERPSFQSQSEGTLRRENDRIVLTGLNLVTRGRMGLKGKVSVDGEKNLSGELKVGLPDSMIRSAASQRLNQIFEEDSIEGFRWVTIRLSGTTDAPKDDFREQYNEAGTPEKKQDDYKTSTFEELTQPKGN